MTWQKRVLPQYQFVMSQRRIPSVFFPKFIFFNHFIEVFSPQIVHFLTVPLQIHFMQNYFKYFYIWKNFKSFSSLRSFEKKPELSASSVGINIPPTVYQVLTHTRYTLCAHCTVAFSLVGRYIHASPIVSRDRTRTHQWTRPAKASIRRRISHRWGAPRRADW